MKTIFKRFKSFGTGTVQRNTYVNCKCINVNIKHNGISTDK